MGGGASARHRTPPTLSYGGDLVARRKRTQKYNGRFFGLTRDALDNFKRDIPDTYVRMRTVWLLVNMLLVGTWDYYQPDQPFKCSQRRLREQLGWAFHTIRKYRLVLEDLKVLTVNYPGGLYGKANLYKLNIKYMGIRH